MKTMVVIEIGGNGEHAHNIQGTINGYIEVREGWALVPNTIDIGNAYGDITTKKLKKEDATPDFDIRVFGNRDEIDVVDSFTPITPEPQPQEPTEQDDVNAMLVDHELRISMLEIGGDV